MSATGLAVFDTTLEKSHLWINSVNEALGWGDKQLGYQGLRATLHALRDRLTVEGVAHFGAQLPMLVRGIYYEGWRPATNPLKLRHKDEFLALIRERWDHQDTVDPEEVARAVFVTINRFVTPELVAEMRSMIGSSLAELWPEPS